MLFIRNVSFRTPFWEGRAGQVSFVAPRADESALEDWAGAVIEVVGFRGTARGDFLCTFRGRRLARRGLAHGRRLPREQRRPDERLRHNDQKDSCSLGLLERARSLLAYWSGERRSRAASPFVADQPGAVVPAAVDAEVLLIHATNDADAGVDPRVGKIPKLGDTRATRCSRAPTCRSKIGPYRHLVAEWANTSNQPERRQRRAIRDRHQHQSARWIDVLPLLEVRASVDVPVYIAGQSYQGGMLIIAIKILPH